MQLQPTAGARKRAKKLRRLLRAWSLTNGRCVYCDSLTPAAFRTVDHLIPRGHGGGTTSSNLLPACYHCNNARGTTFPPSRLAHQRWKSLVKSMETNLSNPTPPTPCYQNPK